MKKLLVFFSSIAILTLFFIPITFSATADTEWNPTDETWTLVDDCADPSKAFCYNPAINWQGQMITASTDFWGGELGDTNGCMMAIVKDELDMFVVYECKPGSSVALNVLSKYGNFDGDNLKETSKIRVYTSEDLTKWTEVTGDNYGYYNAGFAPGSTNQNHKSIYVGAKVVPDNHRYVKFAIPPFDFDSTFTAINAFLMKGGTDYTGHDNDSYFLHDDLEDLWAHTFAVGGANNPGWNVWTQGPQEGQNSMNNPEGDAMVWPNDYAAGNYVVYRVAPNSHVVFRCGQSIFIAPHIEFPAETGITWCYNSARSTSVYTLQVSKDCINWEDINFDVQIYPFQGGAQDGAWNNWYSQGHDRVYLGVDMPDGYQYVRLVFPEAPTKFTAVDLMTQPWDVSLNEFTAWSDNPNTEEPSRVPYLKDSRLSKYFTIVTSAEEGNTIAPAANMLVKDFMDVFTVSSPYSLSILTKYDEVPDNNAALSTGMKLVVSIGDLQLTYYTIDTLDSEGEWEDILDELNQTTTPTNAPTNGTSSSGGPKTGEASSVISSFALLAIIGAATIFATKKRIK